MRRKIVKALAILADRLDKNGLLKEADSVDRMIRTAMYSVEDFEKDLKIGEFAWPGGYQRTFTMSDGDTLCFDCAKQNKEEIIDAIENHDNSGWRPEGTHIFYEGATDQCSHCNKDIESSYGDPNKE